MMQNRVGDEQSTVEVSHLMEGVSGLKASKSRIGLDASGESGV